MKDQLIESSYVDVGRLAIKQAVKLGAGVVKGPFGESRQKKKWKRGSDTSAWGLQQQRGHAPEVLLRRPVELLPRHGRELAWRIASTSSTCTGCPCGAVAALREHGRVRAKRRRATCSNGQRTTAPDDIGHFSQNLKYIRQLENETEDTTLNRHIVFQYYGPLDRGAIREPVRILRQAEAHGGFREKAQVARNGQYDPTQVGQRGRVVQRQMQVLAFDVNPLESGDLTVQLCSVSTRRRTR